MSHAADGDRLPATMVTQLEVGSVDPFELQRLILKFKLFSWLMGEFSRRILGSNPPYRHMSDFYVPAPAQYVDSAVCT